MRFCDTLSDCVNFRDLAVKKKNRSAIVLDYDCNVPARLLELMGVGCHKCIRCPMKAHVRCQALRARDTFPVAHHRD